MLPKFFASSLFLCIVSFASLVTNANPVWVKSYIQDGLIVHFDAIANNGVNLETKEEIHGSPTLWKELTANISTSKTKNQFVYSYGTDYVTLGSNDSLGGVRFYSNNFKGALENKNCTYQILVKQTSLYANMSFISISNGLSLGDTSSLIPAHPFRSFMYAGKTDVLPFSTAKYLNKYVLVTIVVDNNGASLSFDDGPVVHVNTGNGKKPGSTDTTLFSYAKAQVRSVRIYKKALSPSERIQNAIVDEVRYFGVDEATAFSRIREGENGTEVKVFVSSDDEAIQYSIDDGLTWATKIDTWRQAGEVIKLKARSSQPNVSFTWKGLGKNCVLPNDGTNDTVTISLMRPLFEDIYATAIPDDAVLYWAGGNGNFEDPSKWLLADGTPANFVPSFKNGVVISNAVNAGTTDQITAIEPVNVVSLELGGGDGKCNLLMYHTYTNTVTGDVYLKSRATLSHKSSTPAAHTLPYKMWLDVGGNMTIDSDASINVNGCGYYRGSPSGSIGSSGAAACHGGCTSSSNYAYDSALEPSMAGAGGYYGNGGGVVRLFINGVLVINGSIQADGQSKSNGSLCGAGGAIWIKCAKLNGSGTISANGGYTQKGKSGSGGRIAIYQTDSSAVDFSSFAGTITAYGGYVTTKDGKSSAAAGTIYLQAYNQTPTNATLIVDNLKVIKSNQASIDPYVAYTPLDEKFGLGKIGNLIMRNAAYIAIEDKNIEIYGDFDAGLGNPKLKPYTGELSFCGPDDSLITGNCIFNNLLCTTPGKKLLFGTGSTNCVNIAEGGSLVFNGNKEGNVILSPAVEDELWSLNVAPGANVLVKHVTVDHSDASLGQTIKARASSNKGDNINWIWPGFSICIR